MSTTGNRDLALLRELDGFDRKLARVVGELEELPQELARAEREKRQAEARLEALRQEQKRLAREIARLEGEVKENKAHAGRYRGQQNQAKTNDEYAALKRQILALEEKNGELEDQALEHYLRIDELKEAEKEAQAALAKAQAHFERERSEIEADQRQLEAKRSELEAERTARVEKISADILRLYQRVRDRSGGRALARIQNHRCEACHLKVPSERVSLAHDGDQIVTCPSCSRILYVEQP